MSTNVVRVNGDYKIQTGQGGSITLDTASSDGSVVGNINIVGNLTVTGSTTTGTSTIINTVDLSIKDNTIILNSNEQGNGVTLSTAGIVIKRGTATSGDASIIWDETQTWDDPVSGETKYGLFIFKTAIGGINGIRTTSIDTGGQKLYITPGNNSLSVHGVSNYHLQVTQDNDIPNKKYVDKLVSDTVISIGGAVQQFPPNPNTAGWLYNDGNTLAWTSPTATTVGLGNVTNESKATMFTDAALTGTPTAPTATGTTNTTQIATTEFVQSQVITLLDSVADAGNTLGKLYTLIGTANTNIALKAPIDNPTFTGTVSGVTATMVGLGNVTNESKTTMFASPIFTGTVSGVTALAVGLGNVTNESKTTMFTDPTFTGHPTLEGVTATGATGTGKIVFDGSPTLVTPTLGAATATTINKVTITAPASSATLTIANTKTLSVSNTLTFTGTDSSSVAFSAGGTVAYTSNKLSDLSATTSAELAGVISDETGSGKLVFATSPTFTTSIDGSATFSAFPSSVGLTIGSTATSGNSTVNIATGAVATPHYKTVNIGTNGTGTSQTIITIGTGLNNSTTTTVYGLTATSPSFSTSVITSNNSFDVFNTTATTVNAFGAATLSTIGYSGTGASSTTNINTGALTGAFTKTINIGTGGTTGSTTSINIGSSINGTTTINGGVNLSTRLLVYSQNSTNLTGISTNAMVLGTVAKNVAPSGGQGTFVINSDDLSASALQGSMALITDSTASNRRLTFNVVEQGVAVRNITFGESGGNVGIGISSPAYKLHVVGASAAAGVYATVNNTDATAGSLAGYIGVASGTNNYFVLQQIVGGGTGLTNAGAGSLTIQTSQAQPLIFSTSATARVSIGSTGDVTIGSTDAGNTLRYLDVQNTNTGATAGAIIRLVTSNSAASGNTTVDLVKYKTGAFVISNNDSAGIIAFNNTGAERVRIDPTGNLLVGGITSPIISGPKFHVSATTTSSVGAMAVVNTTAPTKKWSYGPDGNGNFLIYNDASAGMYIAYSGTAWTSTSDERLKTDLVPIEDAVLKVSSLRAVTGRFKTDEEGKSRSFLIAQDVQSVLPEAVDTSNPDALGIQYSETIPLLVAAIKELSAEVKDLKAKVQALTN